MAIKQNVEIQDHEGNIYYPHSSAKTTFLEDGSNVEVNLSGLNSNKYDNVVLENDELKFYANNNEKKVINLSKKKVSKIYNYIKSIRKCYKIAHRGLSSSYPENTLLAIKKAKEYGCDMVEFDVNYTSDNKLILMHDDTLDRTTNGAGNVNSKTLSQIKELNIDGGNNANIFTGLKVPTLEEVLKECKKVGLIPFIEIKRNVPVSLMQEVVNLLEKYSMTENVIITSFNESLLNKIRELNSIITIAPIVDLTQENVERLKTKENLIISTPYPSNFDTTALSKCIENNIPVFTWTVDEESQINTLQGMGIDGIISNKYNDKNIRKVSLYNTGGASFTFKKEFANDTCKISQKDPQTLLITWDIPFYGEERPVAFACEDSGDKLGFIPMTRAGKNNSVEVKFRKPGSLTQINLSDINQTTVYFTVVSMK